MNNLIADGLNMIADGILALRAENEELKAKVEALQSGSDVCWQGDMDRTIKQNLELKEENKKLKEQIEEMKCCEKLELKDVQR